MRQQNEKKKQQILKNSLTCFGVFLFTDFFRYFNIEINYHKIYERYCILHTFDFETYFQEIFKLC